MNELEAINRRLAELEDEKRQLLRRKQQLQQPFSTKLQPAPRFSTDQKVAMFQSLFKGRADVFATRWQNAKGRNGYSIACHNEWVSGKCNKPRIKCQECSHRAYKALDIQAIHEHLSGQHVVGLYPMLPDDLCHLLAVDFDKTGWQEAVKALSQACDALKVPHAIEISRSGNGAHLWIFFDNPVPARDARQFGFALLDKAMEKQPEISFESYDRLFPNQDTLPEGGFGNLIALPLQYEARKQGGFSQFVDVALKPYPDQWEFLSGIQKVSVKQLMAILSQLNPVRPEHMALEDQPPWEQTAPIATTPIANCPEQVTLVLANHLYLLTEPLPALLIARLKRLASFSNPVFFKTQALRFSTNGIPRFISCARIERGYISLPRGCFDLESRKFS